MMDRLDQHRLEPLLADRSAAPTGYGHDATPPARCPPEQRRILLLQAGLGEGVLKRLEAAGYDSIETLKAEGVQEVIDDVSGRGRRGAMRNRCRALERAIAAWAERCNDLAQGSGHGARTTAARATTV
jgi:hypothetical protein